MIEQDKKSKLVGFYVTPKGKDRLLAIADFLFNEMHLITEPSMAEAGRWCLDIGFTIVYNLVEAKSKGQAVGSVTIPLVPVDQPNKNMASPQPTAINNIKDSVTLPVPESSGVEEQ